MRTLLAGLVCLSLAAAIAAEASAGDYAPFGPGPEDYRPFDAAPAAHASRAKKTAAPAEHGWHKKKAAAPLADENRERPARDKASIERSAAEKPKPPADPPLPKPAPQKPDVELWKFTAGWCGPCQAAEPLVARLRARGRRIVEIDVDQRRDLAATHQVAAIPYWLMMIDGQAWEFKRDTPGESWFDAWFAKAEAEWSRRHGHP